MSLSLSLFLSVSRDGMVVSVLLPLVWQVGRGADVAVGVQSARHQPEVQAQLMSADMPSAAHRKDITKSTRLNVVFTSYYQIFSWVVWKFCLFLLRAEPQLLVSSWVIRLRWISPVLYFACSSNCTTLADQKLSRATNFSHFIGKKQEPRVTFGYIVPRFSVLQFEWFRTDQLGRPSGAMGSARYFYVSIALHIKYTSPEPFFQ